MKYRRYILLSIGVTGLILGLFEYLFNRPIGSSYLLSFPYAVIFKKYISVLPCFCGVLGQWLPDFFHAFSFTAISIALFSRSRRSALFFCLLWLIIDCSFELAQIKGFKIGSFGVNGTFDIFDILAVFLGILSAFFLSNILKGEKFNEGYI
ncbi:MAG: hypothetical protein ABIG92_05880 [Candidatus Omnitrophota bacterium]